MVAYIPLFRACSSLRSLCQLHAYLIVDGFLGDALASTKLIESYSQMGCIRSSRLVFYSFRNPDPFMWSVLIKCHVWNGLFEEALSFYQKMLGSLTELGNFIFPSVLRACSAIKDLRMGERVHTRILKSGFVSDSIITTALMSMYGETGSLFNARKLFDSMPVRDSVSWSSIITNFVQGEQAEEGLELFREMLGEGVEIDHVTLLSIAEACGQMSMLRAGRSCHGYAIRRSIGCDHEALGSSFIAMYGKCGDLSIAERLLFKCHYQKSTSSWTALISSYNQNECYLEALRMFINMQNFQVDSNSVTLMNVVCSCARLGRLVQGMSIHGYAIRHNIDINRDSLRSSLIDLYANCGNLRYAHMVFADIQEKHVVSWNILISGYAREGMAHEALLLFIQMMVEGILPDSYALGSALLACGSIDLLDFGCQIHCFTIKTSRLNNEFVKNALIDTYSKCGCVASACRIFHSCQHHSVVTLNCMLCGFLQNGYSKEVLALFDDMYAKKMEMDEITFLCVIQACGNLGFIDRGKSIHHKLISFGLTQDVYIDNALINSYARCGELQMARKLFDNMTQKTVASWSSIIGGYAMNGHIDDSIALFEQMIESGLKPNGIILMNIFSGCSHAGYVEKGKYYFKLFVDVYGIKPNYEHYGCLVDMLSRSGDVNSAYEVMKSMGCPPEASSWSALVNGCRIHGRMDFLGDGDHHQMLMEMKGDDDGDSAGYYKLLSNVYAEAGKWDECVRVKRRMRSLGLKKNPGCSLIHICG